MLGLENDALCSLGTMGIIVCGPHSACSNAGRHHLGPPCQFFARTTAILTVSSHRFQVHTTLFVSPVQDNSSASRLRRKKIQDPVISPPAKDTSTGYCKVINAVVPTHPVLRMVIRRSGTVPFHSIDLPTPFCWLPDPAAQCQAVLYGQRARKHTVLHCADQRIWFVMAESSFKTNRV